MFTIDSAFAFACEAHANQVDKEGKPYIEHVLRVAAPFTNLEDPDYAIVAYLHDVCEDRPDLTSQVYAQLNADCIEAMKVLTKFPGESPMANAQRIIESESMIALLVKMSDLVDNTDISRIPNPTDKDIHRMYKYTGAATLLTSHYESLT